MQVNPYTLSIAIDVEWSTVRMNKRVDKIPVCTTFSMDTINMHEGNTTIAGVLIIIYT